MEPAEEVTSKRPSRGVAFWGVLGVGLAVGLADVAKPVHIDDALYLSIARHIVAHPLDPYGGTINWQQVPEPTFAVSISPPLLSYVFALVVAVAGENVPLLHLAMIPWVLLACWALYRLGERQAGAGAATALLVIVGPAVVVGMNLMLDVPLLGCLCAAVECLLRGGERRQARWDLAAGAIGGVGVLIKFPALVLVPLFLFESVRRRRRGPLLAAVGPLGALVGWQLASRGLYGSTQVQAGLSFLGQFRASFARELVEHTLSMFAILAWTFPVWVLAPWRLGRPGRIAAGVSALVAMAIAAALLKGDRWREPWMGVAFVVGVGLGAFGFVASVLPGARREASESGRDDNGPLLLAWITGVLAIVIPFGPFVAVRSFLPIHPPLALLLLSRRSMTSRRGPVLATIGLSAMLGMSLAVVDFRWAACYSATARRLASELSAGGRPVFFRGHWGWQYYAERAGLRPWDARWREATTGAIVVSPRRADPQWMHPDVLRRLRRRERITVPPGPLGLTTWNRGAGVRFYGGDYGELPWGFSPEPTEEFFVSEVGPPAMFPFSLGPRDGPR